MKIAVTGAGGFIGRHVLTALLQHDVKIVALTRDATRLAGLSEVVSIVEMDIDRHTPDLFEQMGCPDVLIHLVWSGLPNYKSLHHFETELPRQYRFIKTILEAGLPSLLVTGTCFEYGMQSGSLSEDMPTKPSNPYGHAKDTLRQQLEFLKLAKPFNLTWGRLFYMYGDGQPSTSLYSKVKEAVLRGDSAFNMSGGEQLRDYLPVTEVARQIAQLAMAQRDIGVINICSGNPISVREIVKQWLRENDWKIELNLGYYPYADYEPMAFWGDRSRLDESMEEKNGGAYFGGPINSRIYYTKPSITDKEVAYATDAARNGWGGRCYEYITRFEEKFRDFTGANYAIATSSCTGALHMGLAALGVGQGDEVILADTNWIASAAPITYLGAKPIFVDILPDTWCIDPDLAEAAITPKTKAIMAVHLYGNLCEMDRLLEIGAKYGIPVIEDSAEAIGSYWHGHHAGTLGKFGSFSFHGTKTMTTGEGGMFITQDRALYEKVLALSNHGRVVGQAKQFWPDMVGFKYKMSNLQAAIGCAQIERIDDLIAGKRRIFTYYSEHFRDLPLKMNPEATGTVNGFWMPTIVVDEGVPFDREALLASFKADGIDGRVFFWPLSMLPMFENRPENTVSYALHERAINLPTYHDLADEEMGRVIHLVRAHLLGKIHA